MHEYRAMTMFSGIPADGVSNDTLMEIKEWTGPYLSSKHKYAYLYSDPNHGLRTLRVYSKDPASIF